MNEQKNSALLAALALLVGAAGLTLGLLGFLAHSKPQVVLLPSGASQASLPADGEEVKLGGGVHNVQEVFSAGIAVNNNVGFVDGNGNVTSTDLRVTGLSRGNVGHRVQLGMSNGTTTPCTFTNTDPSTSTRAVTLAYVADIGTAASLGSVTWNAGTSTSPGVAPASKMIATNVTRVSNVSVITTTSTAPAVIYQWRGGEKFTFNSGTTTNAGWCVIEY